MKSVFKRIVWISLLLLPLAAAWAMDEEDESAYLAVERKTPLSARSPAVIEVGPEPPAAQPSSEEPLPPDPVSEQGQAARGLYFSAPVVRVLGAEGIVRAVRSARMNAAVIDLKDERGHVGFPTRIPELASSRRSTLGDAKALFSELRAAGIYSIGRIVCFSDPILPRLYPDRAVRDGRPHKRGALWASWGKRNTWLDPYHPQNHAMLVELAKEAEQLGVDELQFDYIRFPVDEASAFAVFPSQSSLSRQEVLLGMLAQIDRAVRIPIGVDVFGLTTMPWGRPEMLGQIPELWAKHVEVFSPMLYLNGMRAWHDQDRAQRAERLIALGVGTLRKRIGDTPVIRPFLQAFPQGADHYDADFIAQQVRGARRGGADGYLFWHPASRYAVVREASAGPFDTLMPFPNAARSAVRERAWSQLQPGATRALASP